jgi:hypothetical protein
MSKTLDDRKVNRNVRKLNRTLANDVFEDRFYARQIQKGRGDGIMYYMYELCDKEQPERNEIVPWETAFAICEFNKIWTAMNDFIITSDFWEKYKRERR